MRRLAVLTVLLIATAFGADRDLAGRFAGQWNSDSSGNGGNIQFALQPAGNGEWKCDLTFSLSDGEVKTSMRETKLLDGKLELVYDFGFEGTSLRSKVKGAWDGMAFHGKYETTQGSQQIDSGSWNATRKK